MKVCRFAIATLVAAALAGTMRIACADDAAALTTEIMTMDASAASKGSGAVTTRIANDFQSFAGSRENSTALVTGLRNGSEVTLTQEGLPSATFTPPTKPMGYGNVSTSLSLAKYQLAQQGITNPTPEQLNVALNGGTITINGQTTEYQGILQMRADGAGWGEIAQQLGTKLGPVVSGIKSQNAVLAKVPATKQPAPLGATTGSSGSATSPTHPKTDARGVGSSGKGIVNASGGSSAGNAKGHGGVSAAGNSGSAPGRGIVTGAGPASGAVTHGNAGGHGGGAVTASGASAGGSAGRGSGNGKAVGHNK